MSKKFLDFSDKFWRGCRNFILHVHRNSLRKNTFLKSVFIVYHFGTLSRNLFAIFREFFRRIVKTAFYLSIRKVWRKTIFWRTYVYFIILGSWAKTFGLVLKKRSQDLSKLLFTSPEEWFEERQSSEKFSFVLLFLHIEQKLFWLSFRKKLGGYAKTVFYLPIGSFRKNNFFTNLCFPNFFGPWTKTFQPIFRKLFGGVVKTAFYVSRGTVGGKLNFLKKVYFLFIFAHWDEDFSHFVGKISVVPSNFHSMSP